MALKLSGSISLTGSLATDSNIVATVVTSSFFTGSYLDSLGNTGSADEILISDGRGGSIYSETSQVTGDSRVAAAANDFSVSWEGGLNFSASAGKVFVPGESAPRSQQGVKGITLSAGDSTHPRFDVFVFSASAADITSGSVEVIEGTPSENPVYPDIDLATEVPLKFVLLKANATVASDGSDETDTNTPDFSTGNLYTDNVSGSGGWYTFGDNSRYTTLNLTNANLSGSIANHNAWSYNMIDYSGSFNNQTVIEIPRENRGTFDSYLGNTPMVFIHPEYETGKGFEIQNFDSLSFEIKFPSAISGSSSSTVSSRRNIQYQTKFAVYLKSFYLKSTGKLASQTVAQTSFKSLNTFPEIDVSSGVFQKVNFPSNKFTMFEKGDVKVNAIIVYFQKTINTAIQNMQEGDNRLYIRSLNWNNGSGTTPEIDQTGTSISKASQTKPTVVSGKRNTLATTAVSSVVVSGENNRVTTKRSFIGAGRYNLIAGNTDSVIGGGSFNSSSNACTFIGGGSNNILTGSAVSSSIIGGLNNSSSLANTHIIGSNITADKANYTYVNNLSIEGVVSGSTFSGSFVGDGSGLTGISGGGGGGSFSPYVTASNGTGILPSTGSNSTTIGANSTIGGGTSNSLSGTCSFIGGGCLNTGSACFSVLGGGRENELLNHYSVTLGGLRNYTNELYAFVGGGCGNCVYNPKADRRFGAIVGGLGNFTNEDYTFIGGGRQNCISGSTSLNYSSGCSSIVGGQCNFLSGNHSVIGGGYLNNVSSSISGSVIAGGYCNNICDANMSGILGGSSNTVSHDESFIIGSGLTSDKANYTFVNNLDVEGTVSASIFSGSFVGSGFVSSSAQTGSAVTEIITLAQSQYDALTPASDVLYVIV